MHIFTCECMLIRRYYLQFVEMNMQDKLSAYVCMYVCMSRRGAGAGSFVDPRPGEADRVQGKEQVHHRRRESVRLQRWFVAYTYIHTHIQEREY